MSLIYRTIGKIQNLNNKIRWRHQRAKRGFADPDVWEVSTWFINIMPKMLDELINYSHIMSNVVIDDYFEENKTKLLKKYKDRADFDFRFGQDDAKEWDNLCEKWNNILKEMRDCFNNASYDNCPIKNKYGEEYERLSTKYYKEHHLIDKKSKNYRTSVFDDFRNEHKELCDKYFQEELRIDKFKEENKKKALALFVKYIDDLMD